MTQKTLVFSNSRAQRPNVQEALQKGPRNKKGDPCFTSLEQMTQFFNEEDVCYLVNKGLYQLDYQKAFHRKRNEEIKLLRAQARELKAQERPDYGTTPSTEHTQSQATVTQQRKVLSTGNSLAKALAKLRTETDADLGPTGEFEVESVPPHLTEEDEARLNSAFAKPDAKGD